MRRSVESAVAVCVLAGALFTGCNASRYRAAVFGIVAPRWMPGTATVARIESFGGTGCGSGNVGYIVSGRDSTWLVAFDRIDSGWNGCTQSLYTTRFEVDVPLSAARTRVGVLGDASDTTWLTIDKSLDAPDDVANILTLRSAATRAPRAGVALYLRTPQDTLFGAGTTASDGTWIVPRDCGLRGDDRLPIRTAGGGILDVVYFEGRDLCRPGGTQMIVYQSP